MNREHGYTLMETLVTLTLMMILSVGGLYGWQRWQQQRRCGKPPSRCGIFCSFCAMTPTRTAVTVCFASAGTRTGLVPTAGAQGRADCTAGSAFTLRPRWPGITLVGVTPGLGFYGLRSTAWAGNLRLQSAAGSWSIVISHWGRIRLCRSDSAGGCQ